MKLMLLLSCAIAGCPNPPNPPPTDADATPVLIDAAGDDASLGALRCCSNLQQLGCTESAGHCAARIDLMIGDKLRQPPFDLTCCAGAGTKEAVKLCPGIVCE